MLKFSNDDRNLYFDITDINEIPQFASWSKKDPEFAEVPCYGLKLNIDDSKSDDNEWIPEKLDYLSDCQDSSNAINSVTRDLGLDACFTMERNCDAESEYKTFGGQDSQQSSAEKLIFWKPLRQFQLALLSLDFVIWPTSFVESAQSQSVMQVADMVLLEMVK